MVRHGNQQQPAAHSNQLALLSNCQAAGQCLTQLQHTARREGEREGEGGGGGERETRGYGGEWGMREGEEGRVGGGKGGREETERGWEGRQEREEEGVMVGGEDGRLPLAAHLEWRPSLTTHYLRISPISHFLRAAQPG